MTAMSSNTTEAEQEGTGRPPSEFHEKVLAVYDYWDDKRKDATAPDRAALDPLIEIPKLLSIVWLLDVERNPWRFRYRLLGSDLVSAGVKSKVGEYLDEQPYLGPVDRSIEAMIKCCETATPYWRRGRPRMRHDRHVSSLQFLSLPLTTGNAPEVGMLMNITVFEWMHRKDW